MKGPRTARRRGPTAILEFAGKAQGPTGWGRETGLSRSTIAGRIRAGWSVEDTLTLPAKKSQPTRRQKSRSRPYGIAQILGIPGVRERRTIPDPAARGITMSGGVHLVCGDGTAPCSRELRLTRVEDNRALTCRLCEKRIDCLEGTRI